MNVLTGETGAGKSILIDALRLVLGERIEMSQIRDKNQICHLEAVFAVEDESLRRVSCISSFLSQDDECLILRREITPEGRSKNYINQQFVNLSQLKGVGSYLVDIHGHTIISRFLIRHPILNLLTPSPDFARIRVKPQIKTCSNLIKNYMRSTPAGLTGRENCLSNAKEKNVKLIF